MTHDPLTYDPYDPLTIVSCVNWDMLHMHWQCWAFSCCEIHTGQIHLYCCRSKVTAFVTLINFICVIPFTSLFLGVTLHLHLNCKVFHYYMGPFHRVMGLFPREDRPRGVVCTVIIPTTSWSAVSWNADCMNAVTRTTWLSVYVTGWATYSWAGPRAADDAPVNTWQGASSQEVECSHWWAC